MKVNMRMPKKKTAQLRGLLKSQKTEFIMEAHNGLSAKIVEEAGFKGVWASGLAISTTLGVRDCNEASWTQILEILEFMAENTSMPILLDGDTGYGNFNNVRRLVRKLEQRGIAGVCIEDKLFPKTNSFIGGERQPLAGIEEFCGRIRAAKDSQADPDFVVIARIEAFIAGWGIEEVLKRAQAYRDAGADALLVHSKADTIEQIASFMDRWDNSCPVVIVPTSYYRTDPQVFQDLNISLVIWGNHMLRSAVTAMQLNARKVFNEKSLVSLDPQMVSLAEIFRLQNMEELREAEKKYLPQKQLAKGIILAASQGPEFGDLTLDRPKAMIELDGMAILERLARTFNNCGIKDITAVLGYRHETVKIDNLNKIIHKKWKGTQNAYSLYQAIDMLSGPVIISYGDIVFEECVLKNLMDTPEDIVLSVDTSWSNGLYDRKYIRHVIGATPPSEMFGSTTCAHLRQIGYDLPKEGLCGEWIGLMKLSTRGAGIFKKYLSELFDGGKEGHLKESLLIFINRLLDAGEDVFVNYFRGRWLDIDNLEDLSRYNSMKKKVVYESS